MAAATMEKKKKKVCKNIKASEGNPLFKGCGKSLVMSNRNFKENTKIKGGFNHTCLKCMVKYEILKEEKQEKAKAVKEAQAKKRKKNKLLKQRAIKEAQRITKKKEADEKALQEAQEVERVAKEAEEVRKAEEADAKKAEEETVEKARIAQEKEEAEAKEAEAEEAQRVALEEALKRPEVTFDQVKQVRAFGKKSEDTIEKLTGLAKLEGNVIIFLHSIMLFADPDDGLFAPLGDIREDMCGRFRADISSASLQPFTRKASDEGWIDCRREHNKPTTHYNITPAGIDWYKLWFLTQETQELPIPIVPKHLRIKKVKEIDTSVQSIDGHSGSSDTGQVNTDLELALNQGQNDVNAKNMYIDFLIDYKKEHKCTNKELGRKIGISGPLVSLACGKARTLSPAHFPAIAELMKINKTKPVTFGESATDSSSSSTEAEANQTEISGQTALPSQYMATDKQLNILVKAIAQVTEEHAEALVGVSKAELEVRIIANSIRFLKDEYHTLTCPTK